MILSGYPNITGDFLFRNQTTYPGLTVHGTPDETVEIWGPDGAAFPTVEEVLAWKDASHSDVERVAKKLAERRREREERIFSSSDGLVARCYAWLQRQCVAPGEKDLQSKSASEALLAGQDLCAQYGGEIRAWIDFGATGFADAMMQPDAARPWLEWTPAGERKAVRQAILETVRSSQGKE